MYASPRYSRHHGGSSSYQTQTQHYTSPSKYSHAQYTSPSKYSGGYDGYSSPVKASAYQQQQHNYYSSPSSPTYYGQQEYYNSGASTASSSSQEGPFYADELDELDDYTMGIASPDMTTIPTVPTPVKLSIYEMGKTPSGRVMVTPGNQTVEFFSCAVNAPLSRCMMVHE
ncbi:P-type ATPase (P-ATPase) Superfamily [Phytophthora cinnamomi]|uniref:P-type ATPase (P-ATPase) Superfamily n=1 Tax=Phytophthora cinnamomi TaxID=4785 RepID=UPI00355A731F|nr:P-type ATPase (P-ATPase) Superfamily [Phytophthora cinnamomi]